MSPFKGNDNKNDKWALVEFHRLTVKYEIYDSL